MSLLSLIPDRLVEITQPGSYRVLASASDEFTDCFLYIQASTVGAISGYDSLKRLLFPGEHAVDVSVGENTVVVAVREGALAAFEYENASSNVDNITYRVYRNMRVIEASDDD